MEDKVYRFYAAALSGFEEVVADELKASLAELSAVRLEKGKRQGRVFFTHRRSPRQLLGLQTPLSVGGVLAQVQGITVGQPGLERLLEHLGRVDLRAAQRLLNACEPDADAASFQLSVTLQGAHRFTKSEVVQRFQTQLRSRGLAPGQGRQLLRLQLQVEGGRALLGLQLGPNRADDCFGAGGIGGPLVSCIGRLLPAGGTTLLAIGCSADGIRSLAGEAGRGAVVGLSAGWANETRDGWVAVAGDPTNLPIGEGGVGVVLDAGFASPYLPRLRELARGVAPGGVVAVLAAQSGPVAALLAAAEGFAVLAALPINLKGRDQVLWMLERVESGEPLLQIDLGGVGG